MTYVNISTAVMLTGWSERTLWRRFADGSVKRNEKNTKHEKVMVLLDSIASNFCVPLSGSENINLIIAADNGEAEAQTDIALIFHENRRFEDCIYWLNLAENQGYAPAMRWLATCYINGEGTEKDENIGLMWLAKAAASGDQIATIQIQGMKNKL